MRPYTLSCPSSSLPAFVALRTRKFCPLTALKSAYPRRNCLGESPSERRENVKKQAHEPAVLGPVFKSHLLGMKKTAQSLGAGLHCVVVQQRRVFTRRGEARRHVSASFATRFYLQCNASEMNKAIDDFIDLFCRKYTDNMSYSLSE